MRNYNYNRPRFGSSLRIGPGTISPFIKLIIIVNTAVYILQSLIGGRMDVLFGLTPSMFFGQFPNYTYQVFTYMFLHGGFFHLFFNMFVLWMFGTEIEFAWGTRVFARFYILCGLAGAILSLAAQSLFPAGVIIGASGAIYGVLIAYWLMFPNRMLYLYFLVPVKVKWAVPGFMLLGLLFGGSNVAHMAHLGGALWGYLHLKFDWRWFAVGKTVKDLKYKRQTARLNRNRQKAEDTMKRVDAILDKINEVGIENLTSEEREFLEQASSELSHKREK